MQRCVRSSHCSSTRRPSNSLILSQRSPSPAKCSTHLLAPKPIGVRDASRSNARCVRSLRSSRIDEDGSPFAHREACDHHRFPSPSKRVECGKKISKILARNVPSKTVTRQNHLFPVAASANWSTPTKRRTRFQSGLLRFDKTKRLPKHPRSLRACRLLVVRRAASRCRSDASQSDHHRVDTRAAN